MAMYLKQQGKSVILVDLDTVNPYFRSADFTQQLQKQGIEVLAPLYANTNLDIPALSAEIYSVFNRKDSTVIFDVGGDEDGAYALGRFSHLIEESGYDMLYVVNKFRYFTREPSECVDLLREIEAASRLKGSFIVNNSNLGQETTVQDVENSVSFARDISTLTGLPLLCNTCKDDLPVTGDDYFKVSIYVKPPWEK